MSVGNPRIGKEKSTRFIKGSAYKYDQAVVWSTHYTAALNSGYTESSGSCYAGQQCAQSLNRAYSYGLKHFLRYAGLFNSGLGQGLPVYDVIRHKRRMLAGPFGKFILKKVYEADTLYRHHSPFTGNTGDLNNRSHLSTPLLDYNTKVNTENIVSQSRIPSFQYNIIHDARRAARAHLFRSSFGSLWIDNTLPLVDKQFSRRLSLEPTGKYSGINPAHGQRLVTDVNRYKVITSLMEDYIIKCGSDPTNKKFSSSEELEKTLSSAGSIKPVSGTGLTPKGDDNRYRGCPGIAKRIDIPCGAVGDFYGISPTMFQCYDNVVNTNDWNYYRGLKLLNPSFPRIHNQELGYNGAVKHGIVTYVNPKKHSVDVTDKGEVNVSKYTENVKITNTILTDLQGNPLESDARRMAKIKIKDAEMYLHTVTGAMGHIR